MKYYNYLLFRIYNSLNDPKKQNSEITKTILLVNTSTLIVWIVFYTFFLVINFFFNGFLNCIIPRTEVIFIYLIIIAFLNYFLFIKDKKFLNYQFNVDKKGGFLTVLVIILILAVAIFMIKINRDIKEKEMIKGNVSKLVINNLQKLTI